MVESIATPNGTITVENPGSGDHRTFKISTQPDSAKFAPGKRIVSLLTGPSNTEDFTAFGFVEDNGRITLWSKYRTPHYQKLAFLLEKPEQASAKWGMSYLWAARCRRCNRTLTTPDSVNTGIGPNCRVGIAV
jgi:hypothetical protein